MHLTFMFVFKGIHGCERALLTASYISKLNMHVVTLSSACSLVLGRRQSIRFKRMRIQHFMYTYNVLLGILLANFLKLCPI